MSNKTISINTSYFNMNGTKTRKKKEKQNLKPFIHSKPLINSNSLKKKFLKRIKEHKQQETQKLSNDISKEETFSDEFNDSINYLQTLSKQKKVNDEKTNYEKQKQSRRESIERKTIKNHQQMNTPINSQQVNTELPEELKIEVMPIQKENNQFVLNKSNKDNVPYGILKGGLKPTYRDWTKTQRNNIVVNPNSALTIDSNKISKEKLEREMRLQNLREKIKNKEQEKLLKNADELNKTQIVQTKSIVEPIITQVQTNQPIVEPIITQVQTNQPIVKQIITPVQTNQPIVEPVLEKIIANKKITKKTIKKKYTLGKSKIKKIVGVLIKDRGTRKQVISAQKDLKKKSINDIKSYLRDHNLIKVGSNAPNDVIRKLYESAMLSGEITNNNSEILLHNLSKDEKIL